MSAKVKQLNEQLVKLGDNNRVHWLDMWNQFADANGNIKTDHFKNGDKVHLSDKGYQTWQQTMEPLLKQLLA